MKARMFDILNEIEESNSSGSGFYGKQSCKKGKKNKGTVISLQSFLANGDAPAGTTQVSKKIRNVDGDDSDDGSNSMPLVYQLPTAPRANRIFDDDSIPHKPPFIAYLTNLPFDADEDDINDFFGSIPIVSLRLPREDGETGRVRGFGYVEFETRDDLIDVLSLPDPSIKGRRIRIELSNENEQQNNRQRGNRRGFEGFGNSGENRDSTNWRRDNQSQEPGGYGNNYDRGYNRDRKFTQEDNSAPGSWRTGSRPPLSLSPRSDRGTDRPRDTNSRTRHFDREDRERIGMPNPRDEEPVQERPKLNLKPRTLPLPDIATKPESETEISEKDEREKPIKSGGVAPGKVFGSAKPVDTASRELEIEERLSEARRQEKLRQEQEHDDINEKLGEIRLEKTDKENTNSAISWRRRNDPVESSKDDDRNYSPERIGNSNLDDRRRDNRDRDFSSYNKNRDRNERTELSKVRPEQQVQDGKQTDDSKTKRDTKTERSLPKYQPNQSEPVLQSSNKYSGLDDEASD